jgi:hypothetical protein
MFEVKEAMASSNTIESTIARIENNCIPVHSGESGCACSTMTPINSSSGAYIPPRKNPSLGSKVRNKYHSNKGSIASHKINHRKLQLSVKVINFFLNLTFFTCRSLIFVIVYNRALSTNIRLASSF